MAVPGEGAVAVVTGSLETNDHADKVRGFAATLATIAPHLTLMPAVESHENPEEAYKAAVKLLRRRPRPSGIYVNTANSLPVLRSLSEAGLLGQVKVVTTDIFKALLPMLESGKVLASLYQRPFAQGRTALDALLHFLISGIKPPESTLLAPHVILRSNLSMFIRTPDGIEMTEPPNL
jgi:LacI family transcriptional regulator